MSDGVKLAVLWLDKPGDEGPDRLPFLIQSLKSRERCHCQASNVGITDSLGVNRREKGIWMVRGWPANFHVVRRGSSLPLWSEALLPGAGPALLGLRWPERLVLLFSWLEA